MYPMVFSPAAQGSSNSQGKIPSPQAFSASPAPGRHLLLCFGGALIPLSSPKSVFLDFLVEKSVTFLSSPGYVRSFSIILEIPDSGTGNIPTAQAEPGVCQLRVSSPSIPKYGINPTFVDLVLPLSSLCLGDAPKIQPCVWN